MHKEKERPYPADFDEDILEEVNAVASATECTGLIQIPPTDDSEADSYNNIYSIPKQINDLPKK